MDRLLRPEVVTNGGSDMTENYVSLWDFLDGDYSSCEESLESSLEVATRDLYESKTFDNLYRLLDEAATGMLNKFSKKTVRVNLPKKVFNEFKETFFEEFEEFEKAMEMDIDYISPLVSKETIKEWLSQVEIKEEIRK